VANFEPCREVERTPTARLAFNPNSIAHHLDQMATDGKAQPGPAVSSRRRPVNLNKWVENRLMSIGRDAYSCVSYRKPKTDLVGSMGPQADAHRNIATFGKFDGVVDEKSEELAQAPGITR
jgi:hypothetical protein